MAERIISACTFALCGMLFVFGAFVIVAFQSVIGVFGGIIAIVASIAFGAIAYELSKDGDGK